jgi:ABC-type lipoprotein release transport system permease subunit
MIKKNSRFEQLKIDHRVGQFLARRELSRSSKWTTSLIVFVMLLTFLNLVVVSGILVGLIQGSLDQYKKFSSGDIIISSFLDRDVIENTQEIIPIIETAPFIDAYSVRYSSGGQVEANFRNVVLKDEKRNVVSTFITGINPKKEDQVTSLSSLIVEGSFIDEFDSDAIVIGSFLLQEYNRNEFPGLTTLTNTGVGSRVLVKIGTSSKEFVIKGIIKSKVNDVDGKVFMLESEFRKLANRNNLNANDIAIRLVPGSDALVTKQALIDSGVGESARVQTSEEAIPQFLEQIKTTFSLLGNGISAIGLVVAAITIFIVIFVNAITRRRYIGILKGIGITQRAIIISYILQSLFYALTGSILGIIIVFAFLKPFFDANPINFPFSDGILVATVSGTALRTVILLIATIIAGYIPSRMIIKQNTLAAILGR